MDEIRGLSKKFDLTSIFVILYEDSPQKTKYMKNKIRISLLGIVLVAIPLFFTTPICSGQNYDSGFIPDNVLSQEWIMGSPTGSPWMDTVGFAEFEVYGGQVTYLAGDRLTVIFHTDFPEAGFGDGQIRGWDDSLYLPADLFFWVGGQEYAVVLVDHAGPPADPNFTPEDNMPPGSILPADQVSKGKIYSVSSWFSPEDLLLTASAVGEYYDESAPKKMQAWIRQGIEVGVAEISWVNGSVGLYEVQISIQTSFFPDPPFSITFLWGTATCGNDAVFLTVNIPPKPTSANLLFAEAKMKLDGVGVVVSWQSGVEVNSLGYSLEKFSDDLWKRMGDGLLIPATGGNSNYRVEDPSGVVGDEYRLREIDLSGRSSTLARMKVLPPVGFRLEIRKLKGGELEIFAPSLGEGEFILQVAPDISGPWSVFQPLPFVGPLVIKAGEGRRFFRIISE